MFSESTSKIITGLKFDPEAEIVSCVVPLGSIFWSDELPHLKFLAFTEAVDRNAVLKLFAIRMNYWDTGEVSVEDRSIWDAARRQFPEWAFFRRLELTTSQRVVHEAAQRETENFFDEFLKLGDDVTVSESEDGYSSFSVTIDLTKE